jgi:hypothetical protein
MGKTLDGITTLTLVDNTEFQIDSDTGPKGKAFGGP